MCRCVFSVCSLRPIVEGYEESCRIAVRKCVKIFALVGKHIIYQRRRRLSTRARSEQERSPPVVKPRKACVARALSPFRAPSPPPPARATSDEEARGRRRKRETEGRARRDEERRSEREKGLGPGLSYRELSRARRTSTVPPSSNLPLRARTPVTRETADNLAGQNRRRTITAVGNSRR